MEAAEKRWNVRLAEMLESRPFDGTAAAPLHGREKLTDMRTKVALCLQASSRVGRLFEKHNAAPETFGLVKRGNRGKARAGLRAFT